MLRRLAALLLLGTSFSAHAQSEAPIVLTTTTGNIEGSLLLPAGSTPVPAVLIIAGSGPTDRDGNNKMLPGKNESLKLIAQTLQRAGIASIRFDKRGIGASASAGPSEADLRFESYVNDAAAWLTKMKGDKRFSAIGVVGHSEGALIGLMAAQQVPVAAYVSVSGVARNAADILRGQLKGQLPPELDAVSERILTSLQKGELVPDAPASLNVLYRPSVQPYLVSWFRYTPTAEIAKLKMPVLILQGTTDFQVTADNANMLGAANPAAKVSIIPGMNHVLKQFAGTQAEQMKSYSDPALPLAPGFVEALQGFLGTALK
jgi:pimeloyl-ACP methyl ester carboxylesterase